MRTLRHFKLITRLVLVFIALLLATKLLTPGIHPEHTLVVCTGNGTMSIVVQSDDGNTTEQTTGHSHTGLDCPLCTSVAAPLRIFSTTADTIHPLAHALNSIPAAHIAARTAAPLPARGPPSL
ncbi:MAG: DUF2946 family protein [Comamonadaceae bacterium]